MYHQWMKKVLNIACNEMSAAAMGIVLVDWPRFEVDS
jgi:hypothetical protein